MNISNYTTKFGTLTFSQKVGDEYFWEASYQWKSDFYKETLQLPFSVFSKSKTIAPDTIAFIEKILVSADKLVAKALFYFQKQLLICSDSFHLSEEEKRLLSVPLQEVPFESPQFLFYDNKEWILHFAEGGFSFCEPYGVSFHFEEEKPILIENLEDAEEI
ncbi:hypothetical protein HMPREF1321_1011 [Capnocytophaga sp. oral taxon 412 str. F0487]|uniref:hypothetical protein n=1 Tax=Capnocytophaga sp. oral taxon 412 TaxID=712218 RepID=UPI0002696C30|nr:hypothetical protein [Capnocytophaga sp. oral taxon 412]EIW93635.1 hypothetical protein HMPREF1321_1011 [Capnocytophaga sp. oral taxon 412 str. F0487]